MKNCRDTGVFLRIHRAIELELEIGNWLGALVIHRFFFIFFSFPRGFSASGLSGDSLAPAVVSSATWEFLFSIHRERRSFNLLALNDKYEEMATTFSCNDEYTRHVRRVITTYYSN